MLYPNKIKKNYQKRVSYAGRGMDLEKLINEANKYYLVNDLAVIYKKPTPVSISKVTDVGNDQKAIKGMLKQKSTLDYVGLYKGKYLDFDAKVSLNKTSFPLANIHDHQLKHIKRINNHGGIAFLILEIDNSFYLLKGQDLIDFTTTYTRKSIPNDYIKEKGFIINLGYNPTLDYLKVIEKNIIKES